MKKLIVILMLLCASAFGQTGIYIADGGHGPLQTTAVVNGVTVNVPTSAVTIHISPTTGTGCPLSQRATTYTDSTLGTPCSTSTQVVLDGTTTCVAGSDSLGNWGAWVASANLLWDYVDSGGNCHGPYFVTANSSPNSNAWSSLTTSTANTTVPQANFKSSFTYTSPSANTPEFSWYGSLNTGVGIVPADGGIVVGLPQPANDPVNSLFGQGYYAIAVGSLSGTQTVNHLVKWSDFGGSAEPIMATKTDTIGKVFGIYVHSTGTIPFYVAIAGIANCAFDGATTDLDWVTVSSTVDGDCHDAGASVPATSVTTIGKVLSTNVSAGTYLVQLQISR